MKNKKYELTAETRDGLFRIRAKVAFGTIAAGELGGFIATEHNLSVSGNAWVFGDASFLLIGPIGSRRASLSIYVDTKIKVRYTTGCFSGSRAELLAAVKKTHKAGTLYRKQYEAALVMAKLVK
jgi:hypothetical protein